MSECQYYQELISRMLDKDLSKRERAAVMEHLDSCSECAAMFEAFSMLSNNVSANLVDPPEELTEDIMANIRRSEMIRKNRKLSRQMKTVIASAACVAVLVAVVGGFSIIKNLRTQDAVYEPKLSEGNIYVDPASGSTASDGMTEASVAGTNTDTGSQNSLPPIQFGETIVSSSASVQQGQATLPDFPSAPEQNNTWYGNNSQQSSWYGNNQQTAQIPQQQYPSQQQVQVQQPQQQQVQVQQQPSSGNVVVLQPGPSTAPSTAPNTITVLPNPTVEPTDSPVLGRPFLNFLRPHKTESEQPQQNYVEEQPQQSSVEKQPQQTYIEEQPQQAYIEEQPQQTYIEEQPQQAYIEEQPQQAYIEEQPQQAYIEEQPQEPYVEEQPQQFYIEEQPQESYVDELPQETYVEEQPVVEETPFVEEQPVIEEEPAQTGAVEEIDESLPVRIDLTDYNDAETFVAALLSSDSEEPVVAAEPAVSEDYAFTGEGEAVEEGEFYGEAPAESMESFETSAPKAWDEILPDNAEADRTDILLYKSHDNDRELEIRLYGSDVYLISSDDNGDKTCILSEYSFDTYKAALDEFINGSTDAALRILSEQV